MKIEVIGRHFDVGDALRGHIETRLAAGVAKYFDGDADAHIVLEREGHDVRAECALHLPTGIRLKSRGETADPYASFDAAAERLEKQLRRYKRRLRDHHAERRDAVESRLAAAYVIAGEAEDAPEPESLAPVIIAESTEHIASLTVGEAVMQLDLIDAPVLMFRNHAHGGLNVVYRRSDGNIGWIDPTRDASAA